MSTRYRRVRVICRDLDGAVLLMKWHDTVSGRVFWEPPGGGIKKGEKPRAAARRELYEETGLTVAIPKARVAVEREYEWLGRQYRHTEAFFFVTTTATEVALAAPTATESATFVEMRFVSLGEIGHLSDPLEPPTLVALLADR